MWQLFLDDLSTHDKFSSDEEWLNYINWWGYNVVADKNSVLEYYSKLSFEEANELLKELY